MKNWLIEIQIEFSRQHSECRYITVYARDEDHAREMGDRAGEMIVGDWGDDTPNYYITRASALE